MILKIYPYQISKNKQCSHFLKTILNLSIFKLANLTCKNSCTEKNLVQLH